MKWWQQVIGILAAFVVGYLIGHNTENVKYTTNTLLKVDTLTKTIEHTADHFFHSSSRDTVYLPSTSDTVYLTHTYIDTMLYSQKDVIDSIDTMQVKAKIVSTVWGNNIFRNVWSIQNYRKTELIQSNPRIFIGGSIHSSVAPSVAYMDNRAIYFCDYDIKNKFIGGGVLIRIK